MRFQIQKNKQRRKKQWKLISPLLRRDIKKDEPQ